ncbi:MAG: ABC transporter permease, partial [Pseudolabrys sp.]|nr:ABC transporter permease [Pseudolabrys sp.]
MTSATLQHAAFVLRGNPITGIAAVGSTMLILVGLFAPWLAPYDPIASDVANALQAPSAAHWAGTDQLGRDV